MDDLKWFIGFLVVIAIVWFGGRSALNQASTPAPVKTGTAQSAPKTPAQQLAEAEKELKRLQAEAARAEEERYASPLKGKIRIISLVRGATPEQEHVLIQASSQNTEPVIITGLSVRSGVTLISQTVPKAWTLPFLNAIGEGEIALLDPGERAYLISGRSPLVISSKTPNTTSFQLNKCTGFLAKGRGFSPAIPLECPLPSQEVLPSGPYALSDACFDYLRTIPRCTVPSSVPTYLSKDGGCSVYVSTKINYGECVVRHKDDTDFYRGEWRMYFGRDTRLWRDRSETVELRDSEGKLIDVKKY